MLKRRVLVIYVGGTLGMAQNSKGALEPVKGYLTSEMRRMTDLNSDKQTIASTMLDMGVPEFDIIEYQELLDSSDMDHNDWLTIAQDIQRYYFQYDGFLIAHGTDTMHYTATALSFLLHNLAKPVIITGAMVPLAEPYNDARRNLVVGMMFAARSDICEVCIFCNDVLLRGNRSVKVRHTLSAFSSPNYSPLALMEAHEFKVRRHLLLPQPSGPLEILSDMTGRVMSVLCHPDFDVESLMKVIAASNEQRVLDCVVLELMGVGGMDAGSARRLQDLTRVASENGVLLVATPQDLVGTLTSRSVQRLKKVCPEIVFVHDMTTEAAAVKAMYLFGKKLPLQRVRELMPLNLRGEVTQLSPSSKL